MDSKEIKSMRTKQLLMLNAFMIPCLFFVLLFPAFSLKSYLPLILIGSFSLLHGVYGLTKNELTKSLIPIFEQVNSYEKAKLGVKWEKQKRRGQWWSIIIGSFLIFMSVISLSGNDISDYLDMKSLIIIFLTVWTVMNFTHWSQFREIDQQNM